ncbi:MAG: riboflavin synthase [Endomicrobium sp.]|jgi:riboflavin synthase|nr:riboflavin synthase [Endomicrobium sp.]
MFTGLIEDIGTVKNVLDSKIEIETKLGDIAKGDSISVNGVCLTAVLVNKGDFTADYSPNTDKITALSKLKRNSKVNLERAIKLSSRFGGHIVSGHVDGTAEIGKIEKLGHFFRVIFSCGENISVHCVDKGSVAVDGISLTLSSVSASGFEIFIIPETFNNTIMQFKKEGDKVNIETDILAKYVKKFVNKKATSISLEMLKENGFF